MLPVPVFSRTGENIWCIEQCSIRMIFKPLYHVTEATGAATCVPSELGQRNGQDVLPFVAFLSLPQTYPQTRCYCALYRTLSNAPRRGLRKQNANWERVTIFLDIVGYFGDYPAVTHAMDVLGHNSRAPCHLCAFLRQDRTGTDGLNYYVYSTSVHSRASSFCREGRRINSVRSGVSSSSLFQSLGLMYQVDEIQCPLHILCDVLSKVRSQVLRTDCGAQVLPSVFDPYRSCMVAPDYLLFGLAQDVINATITLCSSRVRTTAEGLMRDALCLQNLGRQKQLFSKTSLSLHTMTMSDVFAVLLVAPSSFHTALVMHDEDTSV
jgi:hypothetical protein